MSNTVVVPHETLLIEAYRCGPHDLEPMLDRLETLLHEDYFFRRKHFAAILARPQAAVFAILVEHDFAAIAIVYKGSTLTNLYVHPEHKAQGVGTAVLRWLNPSVIRAKGNMSQGNPVAFYEKNGFKATGCDPAKPHIIMMAPVPPPAPTTTQVAKPPISDAKRLHLDTIRKKSITKRKVKKAVADFHRLVAAGIDTNRAKIDALNLLSAEQIALAEQEIALAPATEPQPQSSQWQWPD